MSAGKLPQLTAIVSAFGQPRCLTRLLKSLRHYQPGLRVLVATDRAEPKKIDGCEWVRLSTDTGLAASRNALLARVRTPYFLQMEDGMQLHGRTDIEQLAQDIVREDFDLLAGDVVECQRKLFFTKRKPRPQHGNFVVSPGNEMRLELHRGGREVSVGLLDCDLVHDFFIARTDRVRAMGGWDPELKNVASEEFFFRAQGHGLRVGMCPNVTIWRWNQPASKRTDDRSAKLLALAVEKMGFSSMVDFAGIETTVEVVRSAQAA